MRLLFLRLSPDCPISPVDWLRTLGHSVELAPNPDAALLLLQEKSYDTLVLEGPMAESGYSLLKTLRRQEPFTSRKVSAVTLVTDPEEDSRERCLAAGANDYLSLPVTPDELHRVLERVLHWKKIAQPLADEAKAGMVVIDPAALRKLAALNSEGQSDFVDELIRDYESAAPDHLNQITTSLIGNDFTKLESASHALKSSSATLGLLRLAQICAEIEKSARTKELAGLQDRIPKLPDLLDEALTALRAR